MRRKETSWSSLGAGRPVEGPEVVPEFLRVRRLGRRDAELPRDRRGLRRAEGPAVAEPGGAGRGCGRAFLRCNTAIPHNVVLGLGDQ